MCLPEAARGMRAVRACASKAGEVVDGRKSEEAHICPPRPPESPQRVHTYGELYDQRRAAEAAGMAGRR